MRAWLPILFVVFLAQSSLCYIILLQNLTAQNRYIDIDDDYASVPGVGYQDKANENWVPNQSRGKRKTEDKNERSGQKNSLGENEQRSEENERGPMQYCNYILRNNRLPSFSKRSRHVKKHRGGKQYMIPIITQTPESAKEKSSNMANTKLDLEGSNNSTLAIGSNSNSKQSIIHQHSIADMQHPNKLNHKRGKVAMRGKKHCIHHRKYHNVLNDEMYNNHHVNEHEPNKFGPLTSTIPEIEQTIIYEVYERKINTMHPITNVHEDHTEEPTWNSGGTEIQEIEYQTQTLEPKTRHAGVSQPKVLVTNNTNQKQNRNNLHVLLDDPKEKLLEKIPTDKNGQEVDLFASIKELEAFLASMSKKDYESLFKQNSKTILLATLLIFLLLFCCLYCCMSARVKSSNEATLFLVNPVVSSTSTNRSNDTKKKKKDLTKRRTCESESDDCGRRWERNRSFRHFKRDYVNEKRNKEEERCLLKYEAQHVQKQNCDIYSFKESNNYKDKINRGIPERMKPDTHLCFNGNNEIKELFKTDPTHIYHFSSVDCQSIRPNKHESNVESYAETVTSSANSRYIVTRSNNKKTKAHKNERTRLR